MEGVRGLRGAHTKESSSYSLLTPMGPLVQDTHEPGTLPPGPDGAAKRGPQAPSSPLTGTMTWVTLALSLALPVMLGWPSPSMCLSLSSVAAVCQSPECL